MASINQNQRPPVALPNFCNLGVSLRILLAVNGMSLVSAGLKSSSWVILWQELIGIAAVVQPVLLLSLLLLCLGQKFLERMPYSGGIVIVVLLEELLATLAYFLGRELLATGGYFQLYQYWIFTFLLTAALLAYFNLRSRALSPALAEARLQALQARIRPHFLFNSINAVLSLIRSNPKRAESALEDMADLFRVLMADNLNLVSLEREVALSRQYLGLEQLRLGERLQVTWHIEKMPSDALIPPLVLQPLLENAVYHGIEPSSMPGEICVNIYRSRNLVHLVLRNPYRNEGSHHGGNKMALGNIRERLALHFDAEASLTTQISDNAYQVHIVIPYKQL
ncbi:MAG: histidine kinase [Sulfurimicrobium sp.]|nr:histidine kinase [Sulfurimicrobium sp.]MDP1704608.1 histidine kinase [Sulfurimicrobium sp.]